jgi:hypothetical protein
MVEEPERSGLLPHDDLLDNVRATIILKGQQWLQGNGFVYCKSIGKCLEHIEVGLIPRALEMYDIYDWSSSKDTQNNITLMVPDKHRPLMESLGIQIQKADLVQSSPDEKGMGR